MTKTCIAVIAACLVCPPAFAQHDAHGGGALSAEQVGTVDFQTSCAPAVKADMNRAVALLHSFWFPEARQEFEAIAAKDPSCAMAHWGVALTLLGQSLRRSAHAGDDRHGQGGHREGPGHRHADPA